MKALFIEVTQGEGDGPCDQQQQYFVDEMEDPGLTDLAGSEIEVEVKACGLSSFCHNQAVEEALKKKLSLRLPMGLEISGVVQRVGQDVSSLSVNDHVVGMLPLDSPYSGCSRAIILHEYHAARIPSSLSHELAAGSVGDCVRAYTALYYLAHLQRDETVLVLNAASPFGTMVLQLAIQWGASQVFCTVCDKDEQFFLEDVLKLSSVIVMENVQSGSILQKKVLDQTAGLGIDIIVDSGVNMFRVEDGIQVNPQLPHKHDVISMLATGGRWVTSQANLQLDPPDSHLLHLKCASVCHLFEHAWLLSPSRLGCYQHILKDSMEKLCDGKLRVHIQEKVNLEEVPDAMKSLGERWGKVVIEL